jgi:predicted dehydrogenase
VTKLRAAVVGLGYGRRHIQAYQTLPDVEVIAVVSRNPATRQQAQQEYGIPQAFPDPRDLFALGGVDVISICTPDRLHAEQTLLALDAGIHVLCEKPLATTVEDAAKLVEKAAATGLTLMVGHNFRFMPQFAGVKAKLDAGLLGDPFYGESSYIQDLYAMQDSPPDYWRLRDPQDFFMGGAIHNVDLLRWMLGEVEEVHAYATHVMPFYPLDDNYVANLRFANGAIGRVLLILGARRKEKFRIDLSLFGPEGSLHATLQREEISQDLGRVADDQPMLLATRPANAQSALVAHFVDCVRTGQRPLIDAAEGARTVAVCAAVIRSAHERRAVAVDYSFL